MHLTTSFLILWSCWGLTMEEPRPTPYTFLYSDVDACTRYNFLPINAKNFREAILFFNLCQQLIHVLPAEQRKDYAKYLKHELIMTRNEFRSKNENKDIAQWLEKKIDSLLLELNKQQLDIGNDHTSESLGSQSQLGRGHHWKKPSTKGTVTPRHALRASVSTDNRDLTPKPPEYEDLDQDDLLAEERISLNDLALIGLILGLVSTVSAALTLLYICYCGNKRKKKKAICKNRHKEEKEDNKERPADQQLSRSAVESQMSTKIAKYASGECKVNKSEGCVAQYQSLDPNCSGRTEGQGVQKTNMVADYGKTTDEVRPEYEEIHENLLWNTSAIPEVGATAYSMNMDDIQAVNNTIIQQHASAYNELGYTINERKFSHSFIKDQRQSEYKTMPTSELNRGTDYKEGFGDSEEQKNNRSVFLQPKASIRGLSDRTMDIREPQNLSFAGEDAKSGLPLTYTQQKYSKGQVPLMDSHFPCSVQRQPPLYVQQMASPLQPTPEHVQQPELQKELEMIPLENKEALCMNEHSPQFGTGNLNMGGNQEISKCKNCNKRISTKKRLNFTCENESAMIRSKLVASKTPSALDKTSPPCTMTESENVMRQEKFLCSLSATTPLTTKEQFFKIENKASDKQEIMEEGCQNERSAENTNLQMKDDLCGDAQGSLNKSVIASTDIHFADTEMRKIAEQQRQLYKSLQNPVNKKHHRQKVGYPKSPLAINNPQNKPVHENNSSYYSVKPGSPYQSCAEVDPLLSTKDFGIPEGSQQAENFDGIHKANDTFTSKTQKKIKTVFSRYNRGVRESDEEKLINR